MAYRQDLFLETLRQLNSGRTHEECSKSLNELVQKCRATGKKGTIQLTITVNPDNGDTGQYFLDDQIKVVKPEFKRAKTLMYGTPEGNLQRTDPNQGELQLKSVSQDTEVKQTPDSQAQVKTIS